MKARTTLTLPSKAINQAASVDLQDMAQLDAVIWEIMADFKKRGIDEILDAMVVRGYPRHITDRRMDVLFAKKWFDRNGERGSGVKYVLKKHIKNPTKETQVMEPKASEIKIPQGIPSAFDLLTGIAAKAKEPEVKPIVALPTKVEYVVDPTDHVRVAIWKVTQDRQPYTVIDLATLLDHIPVGTLNYHLRTMAATMFDVTKAEGSKAYVYTMREGVPMPEGLPPYQPNVPAEAKPAEPPVSPQASHQSDQHDNQESNMTDTNTNHLPAAAKPAPLFSMSMAIRGKEFTLAELRAIKHDFMACGLIKSNQSSHHSVFSGDAVKTIEFQVKICDGIVLSMDEARALAVELAKI